MAIVVEENNKNRANLVRILGWVGILVLFGAAIYYVFFAAPEVVVISPPANFQYVTPLASATLHPEDVLNSPGFQSLKSPSFPLPTAQGPAGVGRSDPFLSP